MPRVIILEELAREGLALLEKAKIEYEVRLNLEGPELKEALKGFDGAICRSKPKKVSAEVLEGNTTLKAIVRAGVGTDNIDSQAAQRQGIIVMNTPAGNTISTAEHAITLMMALSRNIHPAYQSLIEGRWDRAKYMGTQLAGKTLGIVGLGRIGQTIASRARALEMRVLGVEPFISRERGAEMGIEMFATAREMLPHVDYLTVHTPLTDETRNMIGEPELAILKPGVRLINCARGGIYNEAALVKGLQEGKIAGVALDVFTEEPCKKSPLFGMPGVLCTPHLGASTEEAQTNVAVEAAELLIDFLATGAIRHAVNMTPIDRKDLESLRMYLDVAYRLGMMFAQMARGAPKRCVLEYRGEVAEKKTKLLNASFATGLLEHALPGTVNIVNAEVLLRERGIELVEQRHVERGDFTSLISAEIVTDQKSYKASGTVFGNQLERLVRLGNYRLDAYLDGILFVFTHQDVPGIVGAVGTILGRHKVNIAQMSVGRAAQGGEAIGVLNLDNEPPAAALEELLAHPGIQSGKVVKLPPAGSLPAWLAG
jgi:D-3-phosphoglycerate dehydrogenase